MISPDDVIYKNRYVWNRYKSDLNRRKHHLSFETASLVFDDPFHTEEFDEENSIMEERFNITGSVTGLINNALVTVCSCLPGRFDTYFFRSKCRPFGGAKLL